MKTLIDGHLFELQGNKGSEDTTLQFYMDPSIHNGQFQDGTTNQEVCRALIQRLQSIDLEQHWQANSMMIEWLRNIIMLHEVRAATRHGYCPVAEANLLDVLGRDAGGIELLDPRRSDGHIYVPVHIITSCFGKCG